MMDCMYCVYKIKFTGQKSILLTNSAQTQSMHQKHNALDISSLSHSFNQMHTEYTNRQPNVQIKSATKRAKR